MLRGHISPSGRLLRGSRSEAAICPQRSFTRRGRPAIFYAPRSAQRSFTRRGRPSDLLRAEVGPFGRPPEPLRASKPEPLRDLEPDSRAGACPPPGPSRRGTSPRPTLDLDLDLV